MNAIRRSIPNIISFANVACGFVAMMKLVGGQHVEAMVWMFLAAVLDGVDGKIASLLNVKSEIGETVDMLADCVSFAVLPGVGLYYFYTLAPDAGWLAKTAAWIAGIGYTSAGLLRELRFVTSQSDRQRHEGFVGLPIAAPAGFNVAFMALANMYPKVLYTPLVMVSVFVLASFHAYLMLRSKIVFHRWGMRGVAAQAGTSIVAGIIGYLFLKSVGAALALLFIGICLVYIYAHVLPALFQRLFGKP